jgi:hypothetical protein
METYSPIDDPAEKPLNLITYVEVHGAHQADSGAVKTSLEDLERRDMKPETMTADTAYGGDGNYELARAAGVELLAPVPGQEPGAKAAKAKRASKAVEDPADEAMSRSFAAGYEAETALEFDEYRETGEAGPFKLSDFGHCPRGKIKYCPMGQGAVSRRNEADDGGRAYFSRGFCDLCGRRGHCPVKFSGAFPSLSYKDEQVRLAARRAYQETDEFKDRYRWRSGIEATNSQLERLGMKKLRVRGMKQVDLRSHLKVLALNIFRVDAFLKCKVG